MSWTGTHNYYDSLPPSLWPPERPSPSCRPSPCASGRHSPSLSPSLLLPPSGLQRGFASDRHLATIWYRSAAFLSCGIRVDHYIIDYLLSTISPNSNVLSWFHNVYYLFNTTGFLNRCRGCRPIKAILSHLSDELVVADDLYHSSKSLTGSTAKNRI